MIAQAVLGGVRVVSGTSGAFRNGSAQVFPHHCRLVALLSPWWQRNLPELEDSSSPSGRSLAFWTTLAILAQLVLGAAFGTAHLESCHTW